MKKIILAIVLIILLAQPVRAMAFNAPSVPDSGSAYMPQESESFGKDLWYIVKNAIYAIKPEIAEAAGVCIGIAAIVLLASMLSGISGKAKQLAEFASIISISVILLQATDVLIDLGTQTVMQISEYGKMLLPVMTAAMAAQGSVSSSASLYTGTTIFSTILTGFITHILVPMLYIFLCLCIASNAITDGILGKLRNFIKWCITWGLKIILYVFTGYMSITGVVSGSADASMIKATKLTISGSVPVVGSILSDASETILVSAGIMKNTAGVYGVLAIVSILIVPFFKIGVQYLLLKMTTAVCGVFGTKRTVSLIQDFTTTMGFVLAMVSTISLLLTIAVVCFMKGVA